MRLIKQSSIVEQSGCFPVQIVLFETDGAQPFVTWTHVKPPISSQYNVTGHYFSTLDEALTDYDERVADLASRLRAAY